MNLKQQISKLRSEILIGKYSSAMILAKQILNKLALLQELGIGNTQTIRQQIQVQYQKCLVVNNITKGTSLKIQESVKKWTCKTPEKKSKWIKKQDQHVGIISPIFPKGEKEDVPSPKIQLGLNQSHLSEEYSLFIQNIQKQVMLPLRMPTFFSGKSQPSKIIRIPIVYYSQLVSYFVENGFFRTTIEQFKEQMLEDSSLLKETKTKQIIAECQQNQIGALKQLKFENFYVIVIVPSEKFSIQSIC